MINYFLCGIIKRKVPYRHTNYLLISSKPPIGVSLIDRCDI